MMDKTKHTTVDEYIAGQRPEIQERLRQMRQAIREAIPNAQEKISWSMPTYVQSGNVVHFAAAKTHIGFYPGASGVEMVLEKTKEYETSKGAVRLPDSKPLPLALVQEIARARAAENDRWAQEKTSAKTEEN